MPGRKRLTAKHRLPGTRLENNTPRCPSGTTNTTAATELPAPTRPGVKSLQESEVLVVKKFNVSLDESKVEQLREAARRRAYILKRNATWVDLLREAADVYLASGNPSELVGTAKVIKKGAQ